MSPEDLSLLWNELKADAANAADTLSRVYRALGDTAIGVRASYQSSKDKVELLIEIPPIWKQRNNLPQWQGVDIDVIPLTIASGSTHQLCISLEDSASEDVFFHFSSDLTAELEGITDCMIRARIVAECLAKWDRFFMKAGASGLSVPAQMGLFAELCCLMRLIEHGLDPYSALASWKGPERGYHDFDVRGNVIEVKSTSSKEPRKVWINNERQLDESGTKSLHLLVNTIAQSDGGGETLPVKVEQVRKRVSSSPGAGFLYDRKLLEAGYLSRHVPRYHRHFTVTKEEVCRVGPITPRIIALPNGVGNIRYTILVSACMNQPIQPDDIFSSIVRNHDANE